VAARPGLADRLRDLVEVAGVQAQTACPDPAVHLLRGAGPDDRSGDAGPGQRPGDGRSGHGRPVPLRDRPKRVAQGQVPREAGRLVLGRPAPPVVGRQRRHPLLREPVGEEARLHRAVDDNAGAVRGAPGDLGSGHVAADEGEGRLQRIDVPHRLADLEPLHVEVRDPGRPHLALLDQPHHDRPGVLERHSRLVRPVELVEVDPLDAQPPERVLALAPDALGAQGPLRLRHGVGFVPLQAALGEDIRPLRRGQLTHRPPHHHLGMAQAVDGRGIDPVHAEPDRVMDGGDRIGVVLWSPSEEPGPAGRPRSEADGRDLETTPAQQPPGQAHRSCIPGKK